MPIFIVGFARSGTTLCQKLVSQHLGIPTLPETHYFEFLEDREPAGGFIRPDAARELLKQLERFLEIDVAALKPLLGRDEVPIRPLFLHLVGQQIGSQPLADKGLWIEKTPGHAEHLERIYQMFPKARFLCMVRDPVHAFASRRELQSTGRGWGEAWKPIEAFCAAWAEHVRNFTSFSERHPGQLLTIRLEDLAADPNAELVRVREFLGPGFATPIESPRHPDIIQPFETWKRDAMKPADAAIADRAGKGLLDEYETWRVKTLLREPMAAFGYPVDAQEPPGLDDLHRRTVASLDWYVEQFARRDALMDVKTTRIRNLLNELAERNAPDAGAAPPRPVVGTLATNPLLVARVGAPARNDATAPADDAPSVTVNIPSTVSAPADAGQATSAPAGPAASGGTKAAPTTRPAQPAGSPNVSSPPVSSAPPSGASSVRPSGAAGATPRPGSPAGQEPPPKASADIGKSGGEGRMAQRPVGPAAGKGPGGAVAQRPSATPAAGLGVGPGQRAASAGAGGLRPGMPGPGLARAGGLAAGAAAAGKPGLRAGLKAGGRGRPGGKAGQGATHAQRQGRNFVVDNEGPLEDNLPPAWRPLTLHGISGVNDNGETFLDEAAEILQRRATQPAAHAGVESGDDITDAAEGA